MKEEAKEIINPTTYAEETHSTEELLEWAEEQRRNFRAGTLPQAFIASLEEIQGWTWESDGPRTTTT